jgi:hypothetical protein
LFSFNISSTFSTQVLINSSPGDALVPLPEPEPPAPADPPPESTVALMTLKSSILL